MSKQAKKTVLKKEEVLRIAHLARLELTDEEVAAAVRDLSGILDHFAVIGNVDTSGVPTADDASGLRNIMRSDEAMQEALCPIPLLLERAPRVKDDHLEVPTVFRRS